MNNAVAISMAKGRPLMGTSLHELEKQSTISSIAVEVGYKVNR